MQRVVESTGTGKSVVLLGSIHCDPVTHNIDTISLFGIRTRLSSRLTDLVDTVYRV